MEQKGSLIVTCEHDEQFIIDMCLEFAVSRATGYLRLRYLPTVRR
jgi:hypothetical protein